LTDPDRPGTLYIEQDLTTEHILVKQGRAPADAAIASVDGNAGSTTSGDESTSRSGFAHIPERGYGSAQHCRLA